ncbi:DUF4233 domain-containing protein [Actinoalloteichus caeruleus]|uniref:DUF4233 domain-containing protein n=1 Tax=Actinoalloteichus cyanogriseus TaxID=2893586 RepID=UPI0004A9EA04|nr:DUF4233 domain-containing protein [Actinoalloteichus caeruleus]
MTDQPTADETRTDPAASSPATPGDGPVAFTPPAKDPFKSFRGVLAGTLVLEAIVVGLAVLVVDNLGSGVGSVGGWLVGGLAVAMVLAAGVQGRSWGLPVAIALQVAMICCAFITPALGALGLVFGLVWVGLLWMRWDVQLRMKEGRLPGQRPVGEHTD